MGLQFRPSDPFGIQRVLEPRGVLPQQADSVDASLPIAEDELLIDVESLNIDSASFHQISESCQGKLDQIQEHVLGLVQRRGKHHNPVTGSGGMLIGRVSQIGPRFPVEEKPVKVGDRIATLVSLSLTPLKIEKILKIFPEIDRIDIQGQAVLFGSGLFAKLPADLPEKVALAVLDVAGAPAQTRKLVQEGQTVVVVGGGGKSGLLCLYEAKKKKNVTTIAVEYSDQAIQRLSSMKMDGPTWANGSGDAKHGEKLADHMIQADARNSLDVMKKVHAITGGKGADLVINVANLPETEMSCILSCRPGGIVYFFSMATSFTRAALGAEGVGADLDLRIGNGYTRGHAELALGCVRESPTLRRYFSETYGA